MTKFEQGIFLKRYKRFFADIHWRGETVVAHVPNTGSLKSCSEPGSECLFSVHDDPSRKLKYTLEMIRAPGGAWVGVNTSTPNKLVRAALENELFPHWKGARIHPEYKISPETRFDFMLERADGSRHFIEVKNVSMAEGSMALFPDAQTERGRKHLRELMRLVNEGHSAELVFIVQRDDVKEFAAARSIDPEYADLLSQATKTGVRISPLMVSLGETGLSIGRSLPFRDLPPERTSATRS